MIVSSRFEKRGYFYHRVRPYLISVDYNAIAGVDLLLGVLDVVDICTPAAVVDEDGPVSGGQSIHGCGSNADVIGQSAHIDIRGALHFQLGI